MDDVKLAEAIMYLYEERVVNNKIVSNTIPSLAETILGQLMEGELVFPVTWHRL